MNNPMDLYSTLSSLLGKKVSPNDELNLSDEEWASLSVSQQDQIAQLLEAAIHHPELMFPEENPRVHSMTSDKANSSAVAESGASKASGSAITGFCNWLHK